MANRKVKLPSGAELEVQVAPLAAAEALSMAVASELRALRMDASQTIDVNFAKDLFCTAVASPAIKAALEPCMKRCLYAGLPISDDTFEPVDARQDLWLAKYEVAYDNVHPFMRGPLSRYGAFFDNIRKLLASLYDAPTT